MWCHSFKSHISSLCFILKLKCLYHVGQIIVLLNKILWKEGLFSQVNLAAIRHWSVSAQGAVSLGKQKTVIWVEEEWHDKLLHGMQFFNWRNKHTVYISAH